MGIFNRPPSDEWSKQVKRQSKQAQDFGKKAKAAKKASKEFGRK